MKKTLLFCTILGSLLSFQFAFAMMPDANDVHYEIRLTVNGNSNRSYKGLSFYSACRKPKEVDYALVPIYIPLGADKTRCDAYVVFGKKHYCNVVVDNGTIVKSPTQTKNWINRCSLDVINIYTSFKGKVYKRATINFNTK